MNSFEPPTNSAPVKHARMAASAGGALDGEARRQQLGPAAAIHVGGREWDGQERWGGVQADAEAGGGRVSAGVGPPSAQRAAVPHFGRATGHRSARRSAGCVSPCVREAVFFLFFQKGLGSGRLSGTSSGRPSQACPPGCPEFRSVLLVFSFVESRNLSVGLRSIQIGAAFPAPASN